VSSSNFSVCGLYLIFCFSVQSSTSQALSTGQ
jgi:hypothetical protein